MLLTHNVIRNIEDISRIEGVSKEYLRERIKQGKIAIACSKIGVKAIGFGEGLKPKFCVIVGTSSYKKDIKSVIIKAKTAIKFGASVIHDGSTSGDIDRIRKVLRNEVNVPLAFSHPVGAIASAAYRGKGIEKVDTSELMDRIEYDIKEGAEILVIPVGITRKLMNKVLTSSRILPCVSKCGSLIMRWMLKHNAENPYYTQIEKILKIAKKNNTILSFVGMCRSGCIADALDEIQMAELKIIKIMVKKTIDYGVQVKAGSGGHIPINKISSFFSFQKRFLGVPIISFGPQITDAFAGRDHLSAAIGQALALLSGVDAFFVITPSEHIRMPTKEDIATGCRMSQLIVHAINLSCGREKDMDMRIFRKRTSKQCSICGEYCAVKTISSLREKKNL